MCALRVGRRIPDRPRHYGFLVPRAAAPLAVSLAARREHLSMANCVICLSAEQIGRKPACRSQRVPVETNLNTVANQVSTIAMFFATLFYSMWHGNCFSRGR